MARSLPLRAKLLYASSSLGSEALGQSRGLWLLYYYSKRPEDEILPLLLVTVLLTVGRLVESFDDALVGYWSDKTRSRWGRRIPWVLFATPGWALFAFLMFTPPAGTGEAMTAVYFFLVLELFYVFSTLSGGPYEALLPEIAPTSRDRVAIVGIRVYFGVAGAVVGLAVSDVLKDAFGFKVMALAIAALALGARYAGLAGIWRYASREAPPTDLSFRESLRETFANRSFLLFLPSFVLFQISLQMLIGLVPYYRDAIVGEDSWVAVRVLTGTAIAGVALAVPLFALLARRTSKRQAYSTAMLLSALTLPLLSVAGFLPWIPKEAQILGAMLLIGAPLAGVYLFPATLTADIIDDETARTGLRREATYYGAQNFVEKTATSVSPLLLGGLLLLGRTAEDPLGLRLAGPGAAVVVFTAFLIFRAYDLPDEVPVAAPVVPGEEPPSDRSRAEIAAQTRSVT